VRTPAAIAATIDNFVIAQTLQISYVQINLREVFAGAIKLRFRIQIDCSWNAGVAEVLPDLPTVADFLPGYEASTWYSGQAPTATR
jgi:hypothetical protein